MNTKSGFILPLLTSLLLSTASSCEKPTGKSAASQTSPPAHLETKRVGEETLATLILTPEAEKRLGIATAEANMVPAIPYYTVAGEVTVPPGQVLVVTSPLAGTVSFDSATPAVGTRAEKGQNLLEIKPLLPIPRDLHTNAQADAAAALTRLETAKQRAERAANMLRDRVGSERAKEDAEEAVKLAETELEAARIRLGQIETAPLEGDVSVRVSAPQDGIVRQMNVAPQQVVSAGTPLFEIVRLDPVWVRTPVYSGDLSDLQRQASAVVRPINAVPGSEGRLAAPAAAPPTADPLSSTTDLYFQLANASLSLHPGEKVSVSIPMRGDKECLQVPYAAILIDMQGGTWVYEQMEPLVFHRRRVLVDSVTGQEACLAQGLSAGALVVTDGAAELFGEEFGVGH